MFNCLNHLGVEVNPFPPLKIRDIFFWGGGGGGGGEAHTEERDTLPF